MNFTKTFLCSILIIFVNSVSAEEFKLLSINKGNISIDGEKCEIGSTFNSDAKVTWESQDQFIKVLCLERKRIAVVSAKAMDIAGKTRIGDLITQHNVLASRQGALTNAMMAEHFFNRKIALFICIDIESYLPVDERHFYYLQYEYNTETINKQLCRRDNRIIIDYDIFRVDGNSVSPFSTNAKLFYYDAEKSVSLLIADCMTIVIEPRHDLLEILHSVSEGNIVDEYLSYKDVFSMCEAFLQSRYPSLYFCPSDLTLFIERTLR